MRQHDVEKLAVGMALQGIENARFLLKKGIEAGHIQDPELRAVLAAALALASAGGETAALEIHRHIQAKASDKELEPFAGTTRIEKLEALERLLAQLSTEDFSRLSMQTTPDGVVVFLKDQAARRKVADMGRELYTGAANGRDLGQTVSESIAELIKLNSSLQCVEGIMTLGEASESAFKDAEEEARGRVVWLSTGYHQLDRMLHGLRPGRIYALGAEEKVGKSLLTASIAFNVARSGSAVGILSMEMSAKEIAARLAGCSELDAADLRARKLSRFSTAVRRCPLYIRSGGISASRLLAVALELVLKHKIRLLILDYLQLVTMNGRGERVNEINETVAGLKSFAMQMEIPIIFVSSLNNKQIYNRGSRKPAPSDLRDSGRIANDCDCLLFLWTPEPDAKPEYREAFVARGRHGEAGTVGLSLNLTSLQFEETPALQLLGAQQKNKEGAW